MKHKKLQKKKKVCLGPRQYFVKLQKKKLYTKSKSDTKVNMEGMK